MDTWRENFIVNTASHDVSLRIKPHELPSLPPFLRQGHMTIALSPLPEPFAIISTLLEFPKIQMIPGMIGWCVFLQITPTRCSFDSAPYLSTVTKATFAPATVSSAAISSVVDTFGVASPSHCLDEENFGWRK